MVADPLVVNTLLLIIGIPVIVGIWRTLSKTNTALDRLGTVVAGFEGQGGVLSEIKLLRERMHKLENDVTALTIHSGIERPATRERS